MRNVKMAELPDVFSADDHEPMLEFGLMPNIHYLGHIKKSEVNKTKAGTGLRLNMQVEIECSEDDDFNPDNCKYKGRLVFIGLNIQNPSAKAVEISQRELRSICDAVKVPEVEDSEELHDITFGFKLGVESSEGFDDKNIIKKYMTEDDLMEQFKS